MPGELRSQNPEVGRKPCFGDPALLEVNIGAAGMATTAGPSA